MGPDTIRMGNAYYKRLFFKEGASLKNTPEGDFQFATLRNGAVRLAYELLGTAGGLPIVLTPGGVSTRHKLRNLAVELLETANRMGIHLQLLLWDRRNMGNSSLAFGESSRAGYMTHV